MYTLFNKSNQKRLIHPNFGQWQTKDYNQAKDMLESCKEYLDASGMSSIKENFVIIDAETGEEVKDASASTLNN